MLGVDLRKTFPTRIVPKKKEYRNKNKDRMEWNGTEWNMNAG